MSDLQEKILKLLKKAESTTFQAEADALFAKAQELMQKYAIEETEIWIRDGKKEIPTRRMVEVKGGVAKGHVLYYIAIQNRCRCWRSSGSDFWTVVGFKSDIDYVEILYHSVVAQSAMALAFARVANPDVHHKVMKREFYESFAVRLNERLKEVNRVQEEQTNGMQLVSLREDAVKEYVDGLGLRFARSSGNNGQYSGAARDAGRAAADKTDISGGRNLRSQRELS